MCSKAPVVMFVFRRLDTVRMILDAVRKYQPDCIYIFADGARKDVIGESEAVDKVRIFLKDSIDWECDKCFYFSENNKGCDSNIREGLDKVFSEQENAIILEDDAIPTLEYFTFCNEMLSRYKDNRVIQFVAGYSSLGDSDVVKDEYTFGKTVPLNGAYATWANRWNECDFDMNRWPSDKKNRMIDGIFYYKELRKQYYKIYDAAYRKELTAWDYLFEYDMLTRNGLAIVPRKNLVTCYGYVEGAYHPQRSSETKRFIKLMTANAKGDKLNLDRDYEVVRNDLYDKTRQKMLLALKGNYFERRIIKLYLVIKEFMYNHLSENSWNAIKRVLVGDKK